MITDLIELGLTPEEAKVYLATLELGGSYASNIARKAKINRATCYHTLNNLKSKNYLRSYNKGKVLWFDAEDPQKILQTQKEKLQKAKNLIPQLLSISNSSTFKPKIRFYERKEGIQEILEDILESSETPDHTKTEVLGYTNLEALSQLFPQYFREYCKRKVSKKIKTRYLVPETEKGFEIIDQFYPKKFDPALLEILQVNREEFYFENEISIYQNKVSVISLNPEELLGIIIESPTFAKSMRSIFNLAWLGATSFIAR